MEPEGSLTLFSPLPCHLVPLRSKYSPQHHILKHPPPTIRIINMTYKIPVSIQNDQQREDRPLQ